MRSSRSSLLLILGLLVVALVVWSSVTSSEVHSPRCATVVLLGDSIFAGWKSFQLSGASRVVNMGVDGETSGMILKRFQSAKFDESTESFCVLLLAGINDISGHHGPYDERVTKEHLTNLVHLILKRNMHPVVFSILPAKGFPWNRAIKDVPGKIEALNRHLEDITTKFNVRYLDFGELMAESDLYLDDGIHPNLGGYGMMQNIVETSLGVQEL